MGFVKNSTKLNNLSNGGRIVKILRSNAGGLLLIGSGTQCMIHIKPRAHLIAENNENTR